MSEVTGEDVTAAAQRLVDAYEASGYGTTRGDRHMPHYSVDDVVLVARAVVSGRTGENQ